MSWSGRDDFPEVPLNLLVIPVERLAQWRASLDLISVLSRQAGHDLVGDPVWKPKRVGETSANGRADGWVGKSCHGHFGVGDVSAQASAPRFVILVTIILHKYIYLHLFSPPANYRD